MSTSQFSSDFQSAGLDSTDISLTYYAMIDAGGGGLCF